MRAAEGEGVSESVRVGGREREREERCACVPVCAYTSVRELGAGILKDDAGSR